MNSGDEVLIEARKAKFDQFYRELISALVEFVDRLGISPAHLVLKEAESYVPYMAEATRDLRSDDDKDRIWFIARVGYFIGEYLCQKLQGCWFVEDEPGSTHFARYVVGRFSSDPRVGVVDPFELAQRYVDTEPPRDLAKLLSEVVATA